MLTNRGGGPHRSLRLPWIVCLGLAACFFGAGDKPAWGHGFFGGNKVPTAKPGYEPCHLLCSNEAGRVEARSTGQAWGNHTLGLRLETIYLSPLGEYQDGTFRPLEEGAEVHVLELLNGIWWRPWPWLQLNAGMPWEYNTARGVVLPTLHATYEPSTELEPGGIYASVVGRLPMGEALNLETWVGVGYRLSSPIGTVDVSDTLDTHPDKGVEALGVGSDDTYVLVSTLWTPEGLPAWAFGAGGELRIHHLPRFETFFATTVSYRASVHRFLGPWWTASLTFSGFTTALHTVGISQTNALLLTPRIRHVLGDHLALSLGLSAEVPGTALNTHALQTVSVHLGLETAL